MKLKDPTKLKHVECPHKVLDGPGGKFTQEIGERICNAIAAGNYRETAAAVAGIHSSTLREWLRKGADGVEPYAEFATAMDAAEGYAEAKALGNISSHSERDWKASAWYLSRKYADRWGDKIQIETGDMLARVLDIAERLLPPDYYDALVDRLSPDKLLTEGDDKD